MKKLMIAAAIVCAAAMSQAASMDWGSNLAISSSENVDYPGCADIGTQYFLYSLDSAVTDITKFSFDGTSLSLEGEKLTQAAPTYVLTEDDWNSSQFRGEALSGTAADLNGYYAIVQYDAASDKDLYSIATYQMSAVTDDGGLKIIDAANMGDSVQLSTAGDLGSAGTWQEVAAPEPTSGLLLLLGVAGLALKRRRA